MGRTSSGGRCDARTPLATREEAARLGWASSQENVLVFGLIDILTKYEKKKRAEHFMFG
eukprot:SAG11_NODE_1121_length_5789_cov_2.695079_4_plen_59_part_00